MMREDLNHYDELVLYCEGKEVVRLMLTPSLRARLGAAWDLIESELGRRIDVGEVFGEMSRRTLARIGA